MMSTIGYATKYFCTDVLGLELEKGSRLSRDIYGASIVVYSSSVEYRFYLYFKKKTLEYFAKAFLNISDIKQVDLVDLSREIANQIVGYAKNILNDKNDVKYSLGTPESLGRADKFLFELDKWELFKVDNKTFKIGYKKI